MENNFTTLPIQKPKRKYAKRKTQPVVESKRKLIDIPKSILKDLTNLATADGVKLKKYIETLLVKQATDENKHRIDLRTAYIEGYKIRAYTSGLKYDEASQLNAIKEFEEWIKKYE